MRLAIVASHPVQYYAPLFRRLASEIDLTVFYAHRDTAVDQAQAGFGHKFTWDVDLLSGYRHQFLKNISVHSGLTRFSGVDTPEIRLELIRERFDAVLVMGWYLKAFLQAIFAAKCEGLPVMVRGDSQLTTPRSWIKRLAKELVYPVFLRQFSAALIVGQQNRDYWLHYRYPLSRMFSSPHCVDTEWFAARATPYARAEVRSRFAIAANTPVVLFAGKLTAFKRPLDVVYGVAKARAAGMPVEVLVAGAGDLADDIQQAARAERVPLHMMGFCNQTEMPSAYAAADALVLPSNGRETWGLVANEALACGRPIVVSDAAGCARDLAENGNAGRTFPLADTEALSVALMALLRSMPSEASIRELANSHSLDAAAAGIVAAARHLLRT